MNLHTAPWLHIRPQHWNHSQAEIVGSVDGLANFARAIADALGEQGIGVANVMASDGEGYCVKVARVGTVDGLGEPFYTHDVASGMAKQEFEFLLSHHKLIEKQNAEAIEALRWCRANGNPHLEKGGDA